MGVHCTDLECIKHEGLDYGHLSLWGCTKPRHPAIIGWANIHRLAMVYPIINTSMGY